MCYHQKTTKMTKKKSEENKEYLHDKKNISIKNASNFDWKEVFMFQKTISTSFIVPSAIL